MLTKLIGLVDENLRLELVNYNAKSQVIVVVHKDNILSNMLRITGVVKQGGFNVVIDELSYFNSCAPTSSISIKE